MVSRIRAPTSRSFTRQLWQRVQEVLDRRYAKRLPRSRHDFAFAGLIACGHCGCSMVGEIKSGVRLLT